jgi:uncharacterized protein (DUF305 family)
MNRRRAATFAFTVAIMGCGGGSDRAKAMAVGPSGDADRDFVAMMIPHHEGAIAMAQAELRYGKNAQLRRMAQEIVVTQQQEITAMRMALP